MTYRDDVAALRAEVDELRAELTELKSEARLDALDKRLSATLDRQAQLEPPFSRGLKIRVGVAAALLLGAGVWLHERVEDVEGDAWVSDQNARNAMNRANAAFNRAQQQSNPYRPIPPPSVPPAFAPIVRRGEVTAVEGEAPVKKGAVCRVKVTSAAAGPELNCRVQIRCDATGEPGEAAPLIYGRTGKGYLLCGLSGGEVTYGKDEDPTGDAGDPKLELDLRNDRVVVADASPEYRVTIDLGTKP